MNKKIILHIPHSSTKIPYLDRFIKDKQKISQEILKLTDWYTDDLFSNKIDVALVTPFSRLFCDVERFANDNLEAMSKFGMGVLYSKFDDGSLLRAVTPELRKRILEGFYWKHHYELLELVKKHLNTYGSCLIVDCHSFPEKTLNRALNKTAFRPDFNIGTDAFHTSRKLVEVATKYFENLGYSLGIDEPYSGTIVPIDCYKKDVRVQSIMLEVNRKLYLSGSEKIADYNKTKEVIQGFLNHMRNVKFNNK